MMNNPIKRGQVWYADLSPVVGSEQGGLRPVVIVQNDIGNKHSPTVIACPLTSQVKNPLPTHATLIYGKCKGSTVLCEQVRTLDKRRMKTLVGVCTEDEMARIDRALHISLNI
jgi:mRNA interferase MazF